jgi:DNA-binding transcriptional LysR family regulator
VEIAIVEGDEAAMIAKLQRGDVDLAFTYEMHVDATIAFEPVASLPTYVLVPEAHALAGRASLSLADLAGQPFILLDLPLSREYLLSLFADQGVAPEIAARSENPETVRSLVACGFGFALMTARPANRAALNGYGLAYVALEGGRPPLAVGIATLKGIRKVRAAQAFEAYVRARVAQTGLPGLAPLA